MGARRPYDIDEGYKRIEELEWKKEHARTYAEVDQLNREIRKIREKIFAEEDRQAQELYNDPESIASDEAMKQSNKEALDRWKAEHHDGEQWWVEPNE